MTAIFRRVDLTDAESDEAPACQVAGVEQALLHLRHHAAFAYGAIVI